MEVEDDVMEQEEATGRVPPFGENPSAVPEGEEDEVVKIVDVYLSQEAAPHLYLLQYPLRPTWRPYDRENITEVRYKPKARKLEFEFALSENEIQNYYDDQVEDHSKTVTLTSTPVLPQTNYAIAVLRSGPEREQLHLTPITGVYQMRPSFAHIDAKEEAKRKKLANPEEAADTKVKKEESTSSEEASKIQVRYGRKETAKQAEMRQMSHNFIRQQEQREEWTKLRYLDETLNYNDAKAYYEKLIAKQTQDVPFDMARERYVDDIASNKSADPTAAVPTSTQPSALTLTDIQKLPSIEQQLMAILTRAHTAPFVSLLELLNAQKREAEVALSLKEIAILVDGRWVLRSEHLYKGRLCRARDYMLLQFHEEGVVNRKALAEKAHISHETARDLLSQIAELELNKGWCLRHPRDNFFASRYPAIVEEHQRYWATNADRLRQSMGDAMEPDADSPYGQPDRSRLAASSGGAQVQDDENRFFGGEVATRLRQVLKEMFSTYGVINMPYLKQQLRDRQEKDPVLNRGTPDALIRHVLNEIAFNIQNAYCAKATGDAVIDKFRTVVVDMYRAKPAVRKKDVDDTCESRLGEKPPTLIYGKIMKELGYVAGGQWIFKKGNGDV